MKKIKEPWVPPFARVERKLRVKVVSMSEGDSLGSEVQVAKENGVSRMTARKAVNVLVAEGLVERRAGVGLFVRAPGALTRKVRLVVGDLTWNAAMRVATTVRQESAKVGIAVEIHDVGGRVEEFSGEVAALKGSGLDGAIVISPHSPVVERELVALAASGFPLVVVDQAMEGMPVAGVASDNVRGGALAAETLAAAGHEYVGFIGDFVAEPVRERWEGFRGRWRELGLHPAAKFDLRDVVRFGDWSDSVKVLVGRIFALKTRPTACFCSCDAVARFVMRSLAGLGLSVPKDVALIGFDDDPIAEWTSPALTTVRQDFGAMGCEAVRLLLERMANPTAAPRTVRVPVAFVSRDSL